MNSGIRKIEEAIEYIEANITSEIDYEQIASHMMLSVYEFRRIFAFVVGCPLSEYVRKRKLSLAACDLLTDTALSIQSVSEKYGYSTISAFSKAFSEYHGYSPTAYRRQAREISLFPRPKFKWSIEGTQTHEFSIINDSAFAIKGYYAISDHTDSCCCEGVWSEFYKLGYDKEIKSEKLYVSYRDNSGKVGCRIGERLADWQGADSTETIPECGWLCVSMNTTDDEAVNLKYNSILYEILPSAKLKRRSGVPTVEVFPADMENDNFIWEIRIPIEKE